MNLTRCAVALIPFLAFGAFAAPTYKTAAVMTPEGSFVARAVSDPDACQLKATRFAADDDAAFEQAIRTHPKFYIFHAKDGDLAKWAARIDRVRDADLRAQVALVAEGAEAAKLKTMCDRRDVSEITLGNIYGCRTAGEGRTRLLNPPGLGSKRWCGLAGRCISGTHRAHASYRVMTPCMAMGEAAGLAAALAAKSGLTPRGVSAQAVRAALAVRGVDLKGHWNANWKKGPHDSQEGGCS